MADKKLPTKEKTIFLIAEHVRVEVGKKITVIGMYGGGDIGIPNGELPAQLSGLGIVVSFLDGVGEFDARFSLISPSGGAMAHDQGIGRMDKRIDQRMNVVLNLIPFHVQEFGNYKFVIHLDEAEYEYEFLVREERDDDSANKWQGAEVAVKQGTEV